jgi:hypothetical protein
MGLRRRHPKRDAAAAAGAEAATSRERAEAELGRQQAAADDEQRQVLGPLRRMRERDHIAEDFADLVRRGYT